MGAARTALLLSPHPDDELLGCPAHLFALRDSGWRIVNVAMTLGSDPGRREQRRAELEEASRRAGFELVLPLAEPGVTQVCELAHSLDATLLVAPSAHDDHPAHERTGRLALAAARAGAAARLWLWGLWSDVALPSSICVFDAGRLEEIALALRAHAGELARNDYERLLWGRAQAGSVLLPERVLGPGASGLPPGSLAEGVCEIAVAPDGELRLCAGRLLDASAFPEPAGESGLVLDTLLDGPSPRRLAEAG